MKRRFLAALGVVAVLGGAVLALGAGTASAPATGTRPAARLLVESPDVATPRHAISGANDTGWMNRHNTLAAKAKAGNIDLYILGDSITDFWEPRYRANWDKNLGGWKPGDFGISADRTQHILWRIENGELDGVKPKVVVLLIGTNNITANATFAANSPEEAAKGVKKILEVIKEKQPQAKIVLMGVFPREDKPAEQPPMAEKIKALNDLIAKFEDGKQIRFVSVNTQMVDKDGKLLPGVMTRDNLHPADGGYQIWADGMKPVLTEWLGPPTPSTSQAATQR